jgi:hypothetical protein
MRIRLFTVITAALMAIAVEGADVAQAGQSRLAALAARQDLRDEVCVAMADGHLSAAERYEVLTDARQILKPEEYQGFREALYRLAPRKPAAAKNSAVRSTKYAVTPVQKRPPAKIVQKTPSAARQRTLPRAETLPKPPVSQEVIVSDLVASDVWFR